MPLTSTSSAIKAHSADEGLPVIRSPREQDFRHIQSLLAETNDLYPGIEAWWANTVQPELRTGRRVALVLDEANSVKGVFIGKRGRRAKVCTLRLRSESRRKGIGTLLLAEGLRQVTGPSTDEVHVTVSEAAEPGCPRFFESMGFWLAAVERNRYVHGVDEFVYSAEAKDLKDRLGKILRQRAERTLFGLTPKAATGEPSDLVMSIRPEYADLMLQGKKTVEFRRRFSDRHAGARVWFYATHPMQTFALRARISYVDRESPNNLWHKHGKWGGISHEAFMEYFGGSQRGYALFLSNLKPITKPLTLACCQKASPGFRPPQAFCTLGLNEPLQKALVNSSPAGGHHGHRNPLQA